ncbi:alpha/beta hydrolase [Terrabacter lapilli]|uniref:Alpha/beta hydrolase n=1 Tax=Terrabacter lapilli TaxID=436231 RepID=A0ABN2RMV4_9MICO
MTDLYYETKGQGPTVVFLHSGVTDLRQWDPHWEALADSFHVVRYDRRGWGRSVLPTEQAPGYSDAEDALDLLDELGIEQAALVGSSGGGVVAQQVASAWPERVSRLILMCADTDGVDPTPAVRSFAQHEEELLRTGDIAGAVELNVETWLGPEASEESRALVREMQRNAFEVQLAAGDNVPREAGPAINLTRATMPAYVINGSRDLDYFGLTADAIADRLPRARRVVLPWAGHLPSLERPSEITELLADALA